MSTTENIIQVEKSSARNATVVVLLGMRVLFSYGKPVAFVEREHPDTVFYADIKLSRTTHKHLSAFLLEYATGSCVSVHPNVFSAWLYEKLRESVKTYPF